MSDQIRMLVSGGGTGGHIFPAVSIANAVKEKCPRAEILFVGAEDRMEMEKVRQPDIRSSGFLSVVFPAGMCGKTFAYCIAL